MHKQLKDCLKIFCTFSHLPLDFSDSKAIIQPNFLTRLSWQRFSNLSSIG
nr:MAG TPA: hypothetical protein [Bacteriophage sp.]